MTGRQPGLPQRLSQLPRPDYLSATALVKPDCLAGHQRQTARFAATLGAPALPKAFERWQPTENLAVCRPSFGKDALALPIAFER